MFSPYIFLYSKIHICRSKNITSDCNKSIKNSEIDPSPLLFQLAHSQHTVATYPHVLHKYVNRLLNKVYEFTQRGSQFLPVEYGVAKGFL